MWRKLLSSCISINSVRIKNRGDSSLFSIINNDGPFVIVKVLNNMIGKNEK